MKNDIINDIPSIVDECSQQVEGGSVKLLEQFKEIESKKTENDK